MLRANKGRKPDGPLFLFPGGEMKERLTAFQQASGFSQHYTGDTAISEYLDQRRRAKLSSSHKA